MRVKYAPIEPRDLGKEDFKHVVNLLQDPILKMWLWKQEQLAQRILLSTITTNEKEAIKLSGKIEFVQALLDYADVAERVEKADEKADDKLNELFQSLI